MGTKYTTNHKQIMVIYSVNKKYYEENKRRRWDDEMGVGEHGLDGVIIKNFLLEEHRNSAKGQLKSSWCQSSCDG